MKPTRCLLTITIVTACALGAVGCGNGSSSTPRPLTVGQLTGDPDDEVSPQLQAQVTEALQRGENDEPVDF